MGNVEAQQEALVRATTGTSLRNFPTIFEEFAARGIPESEIIPRVNVLTYDAWRAKGRHVRRGEHGVRVETWIPIRFEEKQPDGTVKERTARRLKAAVVFHVSQTDADADR